VVRDWDFWVRDSQLPPGGEWRVWLLLAGRGFGKTRTGAEFVRARVGAHTARRIALVAPTAADVRDVMVEGESGILAISRAGDRPDYEPSKRRLTWPNGATATLFSADEPQRLRGPQHDLAWCDELAAWRYPEAWDMLMFGLRLGADPRAVVTTTPRPTKLIKALIADPKVVVTRGATEENRENLAPAFLDQIVRRYQGTRLGRQELDAEILEDAAGLVDNGAVVSAFNSPLGFLTVTLPPASTLNAGWTVAITNDNTKVAAVQVASGDSARIVYPGSGATATSLQLVAGNYELAALQFDGSNFRVMQITPASSAAIGMSGQACIPTWNFPTVSSYAATAADCGSVISSFNSPISSLAVTLPSNTALPVGWSMGFVTDNNRTLTVQVNGTSGGHILMPGTRGSQSSLTLYGQNYEFLRLEFDGSNFRVASVTPATGSANGMFPATGTPSSSSAACQTGQLEVDSNFLYFCTGPNTWKRAAWSAF
jgi:hypothetical protein